MLRCHHCGSQAIPGLAHLHGLTVPLCTACTSKIVENLKLVECEHCKERTKLTREYVPAAAEFDPEEPSLRAA